MAEEKRSQSRLENVALDLEKWMGFQSKVVWKNVIIVSLEHVLTLWAVLKYGMDVKWQTALLTYVTYHVGLFGVSAGAHRYWSHRAFNASRGLRIILMLTFSVSGQKPIYSWVRDHRVHHKYSDTDADPHNTKRGFFFAHVGCYLMRKHPEVVRKGQQIDMSDITNDSIVRFHDRHFLLLKYMNCYIVPTLVATLWGESLMCALAWQYVRYLLLLHTNWGLNSVVHAFGTRPYNKKLKATDYMGFGLLVGTDGYHNYHHAFPWDYSAPEFGHMTLCINTPLLHLFRDLGMAWGFKVPSRWLVEEVMANKGDGTTVNLGRYSEGLNDKVKVDRA